MGAASPAPWRSPAVRSRRPACCRLAVRVRPRQGLGARRDGRLWQLLSPADAGVPGLPAPRRRRPAARPDALPGASESESRRPETPPLRRRFVVVLAVALAGLPLAATALARPLEGPERAIIVDEILAPVGGTELRLRVERQGNGQRLSWEIPPTSRASSTASIAREGRVRATSTARTGERSNVTSRWMSSPQPERARTSTARLNRVSRTGSAPPRTGRTT